MQLLLRRKQATLTHSTSIQSFCVLPASWLRWSVSWPPTAIANNVFYVAKKQIAFLLYINVLHAFLCRHGKMWSALRVCVHVCRSQAGKGGMWIKYVLSLRTSTPSFSRQAVVVITFFSKAGVGLSAGKAVRTAKNNSATGNEIFLPCWG